MIFVRRRSPSSCCWSCLAPPVDPFVPLLLQQQQQQQVSPICLMVNPPTTATTTLAGSNSKRLMTSSTNNISSSRKVSSSTPSTTVPTWSGLVSSYYGGNNNNDNSTDIDPNHPLRQGTRPSWNDEWKRLGLGATLVEYNDIGMGTATSMRESASIGDDADSDIDDTSTTVTSTRPPNKQQQFQFQLLPHNLFFVQIGFGVDQHGDCDDATKAAIRAVRNAIEFNSIPGVIQHIPGGRQEMIIHVKLGIPNYYGSDEQDNNSSNNNNNNKIVSVDVLQVAKVFPYGKLLPIQIVRGGLEFHSGRVVEELGDINDIGICVVACVTIGYNDDDNSSSSHVDDGHHTTFNTKDGY